MSTPFELILYRMVHPGYMHPTFWTELDIGAARYRVGHLVVQHSPTLFPRSNCLFLIPLSAYLVRSVRANSWLPRVIEHGSGILSHPRSRPGRASSYLAHESGLASCIAGLDTPVRYQALVCLVAHPLSSCLYLPSHPLPINHRISFRKAPNVCCSSERFASHAAPQHHRH
jgi:hypothetical protein